MKLLVLAVWVMPVWAHVVSMSSGDLTVTGNRATYELRMPMYEIQHVAGPEKTLLDNIRFASNGEPGRVVSKTCAEDQADGSFKCSVAYEWSKPVEEVEVVCTFSQVTVPNHVHLIRAVKGEKTDQAVFDFSNLKTVIKFRPPTAFELWATAMGSGFARAFSSAAAVLFLGCLALAARNRRELIWITIAFLAGEILSAVIVPMTSWNPAPRFVDAALALTIAYMAVEILSLPTAGQRWIVAGVLGGFHGLSYALYLTGTGYDPLPALSGMLLANVLLIAAFAFLLGRIWRGLSNIAPLANRIAATALLMVGLVWFYQRLRG